MKKLYILAPAIALAIFIVYYLNFAREYEQQEQAKIAAVKKQREDELRKEADLRRKAVEDALALQEQRKSERAEKEARDRAEKDAREAAIEARNKAGREQEKFAKQVDRLKKEIETVETDIGQIEKEKERSRAEEQFLRQYVTAAEGNVKSLEQVLQKIKEADAARAAAEAAAAAKKS
jgi:hypothetical protein